MSENYIRQGITIDGIDVVLVAANSADVDELRGLVEAAADQLGSHILRQGDELGDQRLTQPIIDLATDRIIGYVELASDVDRLAKALFAAGCSGIDPHADALEVLRFLADSEAAEAVWNESPAGEEHELESEQSKPIGDRLVSA